MTPETFLDGRVGLYCGDCLDVLDGFNDDVFHACVTDPPYHFESIVKRFGKAGAAPAKGRLAQMSEGFTGQQWDAGDIAFRPETWAKVLRVLKPGAHLVAFAAPRYVGRLQVAIEQAGFEVRDCVLGLVEQDAAIARFMATLDERQLVAFLRCLDESTFGGLLAWVFGSGMPKSHKVEKLIARGLDDEQLAEVWRGWGTALKPAFEPIVLARKPLVGTIADNVARHGTGALNVDACRIAGAGGHADGAFPANLVTDGSSSARRGFPGEVSSLFYSAKADDDDRLGSAHPTVKPLALMQWLVRLVTPPGGRVLDPFAGTGTTAEAAFREGLHCAAIERSPQYQADIRRRMQLALGGPDERQRAAAKQKEQRKAPEPLPLFAGTTGGLI